MPTGNGASLACAYLAQHNEHRIGQAVDGPGPTVTTRGTQTHVVEAAIAPFVSYGQQGGLNRKACEPHHTVTASSKDTNGVVAAYLVQHNDGPRPGAPGHHLGQPVSTVTATGAQQSLVAAHMLSLKGSDRRAGSAAEPHPTICAGGQHSAVISLPLVSAYYSTGGQHGDIANPMLTVPTKGRFGLTVADAGAPPLSEAQLRKARLVAEFLRAHGVWDGGEFVTIEYAGETWILVDIGMRMLTARELARAQGFPDDYILAAPFKDGVLSDTDQRRMIGNSVCAQVAAALVAANCKDMAIDAKPVEATA
ncbi:hypothetical protein HNS03_24780 [Amorphus sp. 3PC139-8]